MLQLGHVQYAWYSCHQAGGTERLQRHMTAQARIVTDCSDGTLLLQMVMYHLLMYHLPDAWKPALHLLMLDLSKVCGTAALQQCLSCKFISSQNL